MEPITEEQMMELHGALEAERDALLEELSQYGKNVGGDWQGSAETPEGEESDPIDAADQIEELATNVPLVEELETRKKEVDAALKRVKDGTYGVCVSCGTKIPFDRLEANPAAATCIECAR